MYWTFDKVMLIKQVFNTTDSMVVTRKEVLSVCKNYNFDKPNWLFNNKTYRVDHGVYRMPVIPKEKEIVFKKVLTELSSKEK